MKAAKESLAILRSISAGSICRGPEKIWVWRNSWTRTELSSLRESELTILRSGPSRLQPSHTAEHKDPQELWRCQIPHGDLRGLVESMPRQAGALLAAQGGPTAHQAGRPRALARVSVSEGRECNVEFCKWLALRFINVCWWQILEKICFPSFHLSLTGGCKDIRTFRKADEEAIKPAVKSSGQGLSLDDDSWLITISKLAILAHINANSRTKIPSAMPFPIFLNSSEAFPVCTARQKLVP